MGVSDHTERAEEVGRRARNSDGVQHAARAGHAAYGVVHLLIGWLAVQLALGDRSGASNSTGALRELAEQPFGAVLVWVIALGLFLLALWQILEGFTGDHDDDLKGRGKRVAAFGKAVIYGYLGFSGVRVAIGDGNSGGGTDSYAATLMDAPAGQVLVGAVGLAIIGYGGFLVVRGVTDRFTKEIDTDGTRGATGTIVVWVGRVGHVAKGLAYGVIGALFINAAANHQPKKSGGLDQALREVLDQPFGPALLCAIGIGLACYGLFALARARYFTR